MQRTSQQNRALHKAFQLVAESLNDAGLDQRKVLKPSVDIPWTHEAVKENLWRPIQKAMYNKHSTTELDKVKEIEHIWDTLMRHLAEKFHLEYIPFPHDPTRTKENLGGYKSDDRKDLEYPEYAGQPEF